VVGGLTTAAGGILLLGLGSSTATATAGLILIGVGLSLPYPLFYDQGEPVLPDRPVKSLPLLPGGLNSTPSFVVPLFGTALANGRAGQAFAGLAAFTILPLLLNARSPVPSAAPG